MAIDQISRITHRKGLIENLPQLAGGEFGWAVDSRRLFMGNGTLAEGAPVVGNTEILTEYSDILGLASGYTYKGDDGGYTAQTGVTSTGNVVRSLQKKLDEGSASVKDFGAVGDGVTDDTDAINRALYQLFCRAANNEVRRSLFIPAGIYKVSGTIKIPPYTKLYGEGAESTKIYYSSAGTVDDYVVQTADSLQQTGANIGNNGATAPRNIEVSSMTFESTEDAQSVFLLQKAEQCYFDSVNFKGALVQGDLTTDADNTKCIEVESSTALVTQQVTFDKCHLSGATYGFYVDYNCESITVSNSTFDTLYRGAGIGITPVNGGPQGVRIVQSLFDNVAAQGVQIGAVATNMTAYNLFKDVGNQFQGIENSVTTVISIGNADNLSYGDLFERPPPENQDFASESSIKLIELNDTHSSAFSARGFQLGNYERTIGYKTTLNDNTAAATTIFTLDRLRVGGFLVDYTLRRGDYVRTGRISATVGYGSEVASLVETFSETTATGVAFTVTQTGDDVKFNYTTTSTGDDATLTYSIVKFNL